MAPSSAAMTSATPAQRARETSSPPPWPGAGPEPVPERPRTVEAGFADAILRVGGSAREVASSIPSDCGTLEQNTYEGVWRGAT